MASVWLCATMLARGASLFTPADLEAWHAVSDARISPDGAWLAYVEESAGRVNLRLARVDGKGSFTVAADSWRDRAPRFSFDSERLAWLSQRGPAVRITVRRMDTGAETVIGDLPFEPLSVVPAPEGEALAFTALVPSEAPSPAWLPPPLLPRLTPPRAHAQLFVLPAPSAAPRRLSAGEFDYSGEPAWMPDGQTVVAARAEGEIYAFGLSGGERQITHHKGRNECPLPSPDGAKIAWLATDPQPSGYAIRKLCVMNADGSRVRILSGSLDRDAADPQWSSDARTVYFLADDRGATHVYLARNDGTVRQLPGEAARMAGLSLADNGMAVTRRTSAKTADEVAAFPTDRPTEIQVLASPDRDLLAGRAMGGVEEIAYASEGRTIQAWLTRPPGFQRGQKYPLLVDLREDPGWMCGGAFDLRAQIFAAGGFVVLCVNPRGTPGYGEEFGNLLPTRFPDGAAEDVMRGVDAAAATGDIDPRRLYVSGGMLTAWLIGHTDRFAAAIARHPVVDWTTEALLDGDRARRAAAWMGALPWDDPEQYRKHSPLYFAAAFHTRTLVIGEAGDVQADALDFALQSRKVASVRLRLPKSPGPAERALEWEAEIAWLKQASGAAGR